MLMMDETADGLSLVDSMPPSLQRLHLTNDCFTNDEILATDLVKQNRLRSL
jgi:hypothetical protein